MIKNIIVGNQAAIEVGMARQLAVPHVIISVRSKGDRPVRVRHNALCLGVLKLVFDDAEPTDLIPLPDIKLMTEIDARRIWSFVQKHRDQVEVVIVHCYAGMFRSPAIAAALAQALGLPTERFWRKFIPNQHVFRLVLVAFAKPENRLVEKEIDGKISRRS